MTSALSGFGIFAARGVRVIEGQFVRREPKLVRVIGSFEKSRVREIGGEIIELEWSKSKPTRFGSRYREVRETEGSRNRDSTVYRKTARKHAGNNVIPVNPQLYGLIKGHASSCKCLRAQIDEKRMSLVQPYFENCWLIKLRWSSLHLIYVTSS